MKISRRNFLGNTVENCSRKGKLSVVRSYASKSFRALLGFSSFFLFKTKRQVSVSESCLCGSKTYLQIYTWPRKYNYRLFRCTACGLHRNYPPPSTGVCDEQYQSLVDVGDLHDHQIFVLNLIRRLASNQLPILDIGCSTGKLAHTLLENGFDVYGVEENDSARSIAKTRGLTTFKNIENISPGIYFEVVFMNHVIEHIENIEEFIKSIRPIQKKGAFLIIATPNIDSPLAQRSDWIGLQPTQHFWLFDPINLRNQITKTDDYGFVTAYTLSNFITEKLPIQGDNMVLVFRTT